MRHLASTLLALALFGSSVHADGTLNLLYAPAGADDPELRAEIAAELGGSVDYYDARLDVPSALYLANYDAVCTWPSLGYADPDLFGDRLAHFHDAGGRVILCLNSVRDHGIQGRFRTDGKIPVTLDSAFPAGIGIWDGDHYTNLFDHVEEITTSSHDRLAASYAIGIAWYGTGEYLAVVDSTRRVTYLNGRPLGSSLGGGDWAELIANGARAGRIVRVLIHAPSVALDTYVAYTRERGYLTTHTSSYGAFESELASGEYDLAIVNEQTTLVPESTADVLRDFVEAGGSAILHYWDLDGSLSGPASAILREAFGVAATSSISEPLLMHRWRPSFSFVSGPIMETVPSGFLDNGDRMTPGFGAVAACGFTETEQSDQAAIVIGNEGRTLVAGFLVDDYDAFFMDVVVERMIDYLAHRSRTIVLSNYYSDNQYLERAAVRSGLDPFAVTTLSQVLDDITIRPYDLVLIDRDNDDFTGPESVALAQFVAGGGKIIASNHKITDSIGALEFFGIFSAADVDGPTDVVPESPSHPIFNVPHPVGMIEMTEPVEFGYGVAVRPGFGGTSLAQIASATAPVDSGIVTAQDGRTLFSGFRFGSLDHNVALDFAENQIAFMLGGGSGEGVAFIRGDCNRDGSVEISDAIAGLSSLFDGSGDPTCLDACDTNDDDAFDIADAVALLSHLFVAGSPAPAAPFPGCGVDASPFGCAPSPACP